MKKIAILYSGGNGYGGIYTFFRDIVGYIKKSEKNTQIDIFSITDLPPGNIFDNEYKKNIPNFIKKFIFKFNLHILFSSFFLAIFFYKQLKNYDKIIINQELAFPTTLLFKNSITIVHGTSINPAKVWWKEKKYLYSIFYYFLHINCLLTYKFSKKIYTVSEFTKNIIKKYNKNIEVCGWGVDLDFWKLNKNIKKEDFGFKKEDFLMIFVGRFDIGKGKNILLNLMKKINNKNIKLLCISRKPKDYKNLEKLNIYFFENINEDGIKKLYSISDLFIFPTKYEGYGSVIAEALAIGLPIITTNTGLGNLLKEKYLEKYKNNINILEITDKEEKYLELINKYFKSKLSKTHYNIEEIDIKKSLNYWKNTFIN